MRKVVLAGLMVMMAGTAGANFCARDNVPAATLLFPYIEVSLNPDGSVDPLGQTTISRITNVSRNAVVVHFTVWDLTGVPRVGFSEVLSGYDALEINWRDFLAGRGDLFDTSRVPYAVPTVPPSPNPSSRLTRDPFEWGPDGRGQAGGLTTPDNRDVITAAQCPGPPPYGDRSDLAEWIRTSLSGAVVARSELACSSPWDLLHPHPWTQSPDSSRVFFYVTANVVSGCTDLLPTQPEYWTTVARTDNVLVGEVLYVDAETNTSEMMPAVQIEAASGADGGPSVLGFGEEKSGGAETDREPLGTAFAFGYADSAADHIHSSVIFWKSFNELDVQDDPSAGAWGKVVDCGSYVYYAWDMDERSLSGCWDCPTTNPVYDPQYNQFPFATQQVPLDNRYFDLPGQYGWMLLVLPSSYGSYGYPDNAFYPDGTSGYLSRPYMGWAGLRFDYGTFSAGSPAGTVANALCFPDQTLPLLGANPGTGAVR